MIPILLAAGAAYSRHEIGLFVSISESGNLIPASLGAALIVTGGTIRLLQEQGKAATGQRPDFGGLIYEVGASFFFLAAYATIAQNVWNSCQFIAQHIYPTSKEQALVDIMWKVNDRMGSYTFSLLGAGAALRDTIVELAALVAWTMMLISHWQIEVLQICIYNIIFTFAPVLIGLSLFGIGGRRLWFAAVVEVSSWSITMAVVYKSIDSALYSYLNDAATLDVKDTKILDVLAMLGFLSSLPFVIPIVTGRLLGSQALGALANISVSPMATDRLMAKGRSAMSWASGSVTPGASDTHGHTTPMTKRPGDE